MESRISLLCRDLGAIGEQLLALTDQPWTDESIDGIVALVDRREAVIKEAQVLLSGAEPPGGAPGHLQPLLAQQQVLQAQFTRRLTAMREARAGAQAARAGLQGVRRVLRPNLRSQLVDERK